jgi:hypothetical protein
MYATRSALRDWLRLIWAPLAVAGVAATGLYLVVAFWPL